MELLIRFWRELTHFLRRDRFQHDLAEEMREHLEEKAAELAASGMPAEEARLEAQRQFGNALLLREKSRDAWGFQWLETLLQDLRFGLRQLRRNPGFTAVAVITLALGIGANTAIFSVIDGVLINPLPFEHSNRLVLLGQRVPHFGTNVFTTPDFLAWKKQTFIPIAAHTSLSFNVGEGDRTQHLEAGLVSANFFSLLGVTPIVGRGFLPDEDRPNARRVVVLSYGVWQQDFGGGRSVLGKTLDLNGRPFTVIGVMPPKFSGGLPLTEGIWIPLESEPTFATTRLNRSIHWLFVFGRLKPGISLTRARSAMTAIAGSLGKQYPETDANLGVDVTPLADYVVGSIRPDLLMLFAAVGLVLLIACANVANLVLARSTARAKEIAVRIAVGAGRARLVRQMLTESVLLALVGGGLALVLTFLSLHVLRRLNPGNIPNLEQIGINPGVFLFVVVGCILTGVLFGVAPAYQGSKADLNEVLKEGSRVSGLGSGRKELRQILVVSEVALSLMLLIAAGLMVRSFRALESAPLGFNPHRLLVMQLTPNQPEHSVKEIPAIYKRVLERVRALPGVDLAAIARDLPLVGANPSSPFSIAGQPAQSPQERPIARYRAISPDYFRTMGIPLVKGRAFTEEDDATGPAVVIISQGMARRFWPHRSPIGDQIKPASGASGWCTIIGIVGDVRKGGPVFPIYPTMYYPYLQVPAEYIPLIEGSMRLVIRSSLPASGVVTLVRREVESVNSGTPVYNVQTMDEIVFTSTSRARFDMTLFGIFGLLALLMAIAGIYAIISYWVARRTHEIGIRIAIGASKGQVLRLVVRQGLRLALIGVVLGTIAALILTRFLSSLLYGVKATDPLTFVMAAVVLTAVALLACYLPARRATKVDPMVALRYE
ncbi:MAG TPA: ABC transporter permease [Terriglobia bacterium]|nr:ABC transporter permease [Terriglobia bacterium]